MRINSCMFASTFLRTCSFDHCSFQSTLLHPAIRPHLESFQLNFVFFSMCLRFRTIQYGPYEYSDYSFPRPVFKLVDCANVCFFQNACFAHFGYGSCSVSKLASSVLMWPRYDNISLVQQIFLRCQ